MKRRDFLVYTASSAGALLPTVPHFAASAELSASGDELGAAAHSDIIKDNFRGVEITMPDGSRKLYPDSSKWAFTFWPGTKWPDSYGDGTNWLAGNAECQTYVTPFVSKVKGSPVAAQPALRSIFNPLRWPAYQGVAIESRRSSPPTRLADFGVLVPACCYREPRLPSAMYAWWQNCPSARGSWADLWLLPESHQWPPEIDVFESMPWGKHQQQLHYGVIVPKGAKGWFGDWTELGTDPSAGFHEYGLDWTPESLSGLFDGRVLWQHPTPESLQQNMYLIVNFAVGGKWVFNELNVQPIDSMSPDRLSAGADLIQADYPAEMIIKSISVSALKR